MALIVPRCLFGKKTSRLILRGVSDRLIHHQNREKHMDLQVPEKKQQRWVLIDGTGLLHRAHHIQSYKTLKGADGHPTGVLQGTLTLLNKYVKALYAKENPEDAGEGVSPDHVIAVFDAPGGSYARAALYPEYKKQRPPRPEEIKKQEPWVHAFLKASGIPVLSVMGVESDDTLETLARIISQDLGHKVAIVSSDKDMGQSLRKDVLWFRPDTKEPTGLKRMTSKVVFETFGVKPSQMRDYLVLHGDAADNLPGINKVGEVFAQKLLKHFGSMENMYAVLATPAGQDELTKALGAAAAKRLRPNIDDAKEWLGTMTALVSLESHVPIQPSEYVNREPVNEKMMDDMRVEHRLPSWLGYPLKWQQEKAEQSNLMKRAQASTRSNKP
jgi:5'-3' exonuclease